MTAGDGRRSGRLRAHDYGSPGAYFVTICCAQREELLERPELRRIVEEEWAALPGRFVDVHLDEFVVMPNHAHGIIWLSGSSDVGAALAAALDAPPSLHIPPAPENLPPSPGAGASPAPTLGSVVGAFKSRVAVRWLRWVLQNAPDKPAAVWQRGYYDHVIRTDDELDRVRR